MRWSQSVLPASRVEIDAGQAYLKRPVLTCTWTLDHDVAIPDGTFEHFQEYATAHACESMQNMDGCLFIAVSYKHLLYGGDALRGKHRLIVKLCGEPVMVKRAPSDLRDRVVTYVLMQC